MIERKSPNNLTASPLESCIKCNDKGTKRIMLPNIYGVPVLKFEKCECDPDLRKERDTQRRQRGLNILMEEK